MIKSFKRHLFIVIDHNSKLEVIIIAFFGFIGLMLASLWKIYLHWLSIFVAPLEKPEMFWIIIPIWINWFFTEFFMEKYGTSFGNAISNGVIPILAAFDWIRHLVTLMNEGIIQLSFEGIMKFLLTAAVFSYGVFVIIAGIKLKRIVFFIGRIRWVTYILVMFTPIIYNVVSLNWYTMLAIVIFFPLYYWVIEIFDRITPEPRVYREDS